MMADFPQGFDNLVSTQQGGVRNLGLVAQALTGTLVLQAALYTAMTSAVLAQQAQATALASIANNQAVAHGGITLNNATLTIVTVAQMQASSVVVIMPTNATGALTLWTKGIFATLKTAGLGFTLSTQSGSATGQETFDYVVWGV